MLKKTLITTLALGVVVSTSTIISGAEGKPIYTDDGQLILDTPQAPYIDQSKLENDSNLDSSLDTNVNPEEQAEVIQQPPATVNPAASNDGTSNTDVNTNQGTNTPTARAVTQSAVANQPSMSSTPPGELSISNATYLYGSDNTIVITGNNTISKVTSQTSGIAQNAWTVAGNKITFKPSELDKVSDGSYVLEIEFVDKSVATFTMKVVGKVVMEDYWQQSITSFSKNPLSNTNKDLELTSSSPSVNINFVRIDGVEVPSGKYRVLGSTVIISKDYLETLPETGRARVTIIYDGDRRIDFPLEINSALESSATQAMINC